MNITQKLSLIGAAVVSKGWLSHVESGYIQAFHLTRTGVESVRIITELGLARTLPVGDLFKRYHHPTEYMSMEYRGKLYERYLVCDNREFIEHESLY